VGFRQNQREAAVFCVLFLGWLGPTPGCVRVGELFVTLAALLSRHVTDDVTDVLEKNLGKTVFVTLSRLKRGVPLPPPRSSSPPGTQWKSRFRIGSPRSPPSGPISCTFLQFLKLPKASLSFLKLSKGF
jgi:hypothetical protein